MDKKEATGNEKEVLKEKIKFKIVISNVITSILICFSQKINNINILVSLFDEENKIHEINESNIFVLKLKEENLL